MLSKKAKVGIISIIIFSSLYPVVSTTGYNQNMKNTPASITVVSKKEISKNGFIDLRDIL